MNANPNTTPVPKFPRTPHLVWLSEKPPRDDIVLPRRSISRFAEQVVTLQEKVDGNCVGFYYTQSGDIQLLHRGSVIDPSQDPFFKNLDKWYKRFEDDIFNVCTDRFALFGEWLYWKHTVAYNRLPSYFMAHDMYDRKERRYVPSFEMQHRLSNTHICMNLPLYRGKLPELSKLIADIGKSQFGEEKMEGIYLRLESDEKLLARAKIVTPLFHRRITQEEKHWRQQTLTRNNSLNESESFLNYSTGDQSVR